MPSALAGCLRLVARYEAFGRPACMVFTFRRYDLTPPTFEDCHSLAQQFGLWENNGAGTGYALLRGQDSYFCDADAWSIDPLSNAVFSDTPFRRSGQLADLGSSMYATSSAPLLRWVVGDNRRLLGRTYAVGVAHSTISLGSDLQTCTPDLADDLITTFRKLIPAAPPISVAGMVVLSRRESLTGVAGLVAVPVVDVAMPSHLMGTQRRRSKPAKGPWTGGKVE